MPACPPAAALERLLADALGPGEFEPLEAHLEGCRWCQAALDRLTAADADTWLAPPPDPAATQPPAPPALPGLVLGEEVGRGGSGVVYRGRQPALDRDVAVKLLRAGPLATPAERARLLAEARAAGRLVHPHVARVYEVGEAGGVPYLVLEYVPGGSLAARLAAGPLPPREAAGVAEAVARAVAHAHDHGVVHRDLKPANVLLAGGGLARPVVTDFGLARRLDAADGPTATADALGTPGYMAPEVAAGRAKAAGPGADVWALGAVLYECLTGRPAFRGATPFDTLRLVREQDPVPPRRFLPALDRDLEAVCLRCLEKDPADRYPSANGVADDLRRVLDGRPVAARPGAVRAARKWVRRHPGRAAGVAIAAAGLAAGVAAAVWHERRLADERAEGLVLGLRTADTARVPELVRALGPHRRRAESLLDDVARSAPPDSREWLHAALGLVAVRPELADPLTDRLLAGRPDEVGPIAECLRGAGSPAGDRLLTAALDPAGPPDRRARAAGGYLRAGGDPAGLRPLAPVLAEHLAADNPVSLAAWLDLLRPVHPALGPDLARLATDPARPERERVQAAAALVAVGGAGGSAAEAACAADPLVFRVLFPLLEADRAAALPALRRITAAAPPAGAAEAEVERVARRRATAALALARLGDPGPLDALLPHAPDPTARSHLVDRAGACGLDPRVLAARVDAPAPVSARRAAVLALGGYPPDGLPAGLRAAVADRLVGAYRDDPDAGLHAAAGWLLRARWGLGGRLARVDAELAGRPPDAGRGWFVDRFGRTFGVVAGPVTTTTGSPADEEHRNPVDEGQTAAVVRRTFALAAREVTVAELAAFDPDGGWRVNSPLADGPAASVSAYQAMRFCRWLSEQAGFADADIPYPELPARRAGEPPPPVVLPADYLSRPGYRLPTEAEWEHAARAGAVTPRSYGRGTGLVGSYGWTLLHSDERLRPVGLRMPNDAGLFDTLGNVWELCHPTRGADRDGRLTDDGTGAGFAPAGDEAFMTRGGSFLYLGSFARSAKRYPRGLHQLDRTVGFRLARTLAAHPPAGPSPTGR